MAAKLAQSLIEDLIVHVIAVPSLTEERRRC